MTDFPPTWTTLPPSPIVDGGTFYTESLGSYARRLARLSGMRWGHFLEMIDAECGRGRAYAAEPQRFHKPGNVSLRRAKALERLTGQSLLGATLHSFSGILDCSSTSLDTYAAWCPVCVQSRDHDGVAATRLIWTFLAYSHCSIHGVRLESACASCGFKRLQNVSSGTCSRCERSLCQLQDRVNRPGF
ncbi:TniQ family protein, partial [Stenotrophomonas sp. ISL-67]|nr:TniQ family protein [Stenotrophomonas sp. ISL-67]